SKRRREPRERALAAHAHDRDPLDVDSLRRHDARLEPALRAEPDDRARAGAQRLRYSERREYVAARAAGHDHDRAGRHRTYPRWTMRFGPPCTSRWIRNNRPIASIVVIVLERP